MKKVEFTMFGKTRKVPHRTFTGGKEDIPAKDKWQDTLWVERGEDWYALMGYGNKTILVVERRDFLDAEFDDE